MPALSIWPPVAAAVFSVLLGYAWYHPRIFGRAWMREAGITPEMAERGARRAHIYYALAFAGSLAIAFVLRLFLVSLDITNIPDALKLGMLLSLGLVAPLFLGSVLWEHRSFTFYLLTVGYWFLALLAMSVILIL